MSTSTFLIINLTAGTASNAQTDWNSLDQRIADDASGWVILASSNHRYAEAANERAIRADPSLMNPVRVN